MCFIIIFYFRKAEFTVSAPSVASRDFLGEVSSYFKDVIDLADNQQDCKETVYKLNINLRADKSSLKLNWNTSEEYYLQITTDGIPKIFFL